MFIKFAIKIFHIDGKLTCIVSTGTITHHIHLEIDHSSLLCLRPHNVLACKQINMYWYEFKAGIRGYSNDGP